MIDTSKQVKNITYNGTSLTLYQEEINLQDKSITINSNGTQNISADTGYDGLGNVSVTVNVASSGGSSLLDDYSFVYKDANSLHANSGLGITTRYNKGASSQYVWYISSEASVGNNIINYLQSQSATSTSKYYHGFYYAGSSSTPTLENMKNSTYFNYLGVYKYNSVSIGNNEAINIGNLILFDNDGTILANDSWENVVIALNAHTIDISNGIYFGSTNITSASNNGGRRTLSFI